MKEKTHTKKTFPKEKNMVVLNNTSKYSGSFSMLVPYLAKSTHFFVIMHHRHCPCSRQCACLSVLFPIAAVRRRPPWKFELFSIEIAGKASCGIDQPVAIGFCWLRIAVAWACCDFTKAALGFFGLPPPPPALFMATALCLAVDDAELVGWLLAASVVVFCARPLLFLSSRSSILDMGMPFVIVEIWILRSEIFSLNRRTSFSTRSRVWKKRERKRKHY